jgi:LemA protein
MPKWAAGIGVILGFTVAVIGQAVVGEYNRLVRLDQAVQAQWAQVESVYQRRADLVPNLIETVKGAAGFEKNTLTAVTEARARVGRISGAGLERIASGPATFAEFQEAQDGLSSALTRLMVVV